MPVPIGLCCFFGGLFEEGGCWCGLVKPSRITSQVLISEPRNHSASGVRFINPSFIRNGSYASSTVPGSSPMAVAIVEMPTGHAIKFIH